ncbi:MAG: nucleotide pyrophosphohydrolase [Roseburia sp.]|nr:nucleotide pyrophosphohydrolase [Roseburia sp.]
MKITIEELEAYLYEQYDDKPTINDHSLFMKLVEEIGEVAEVLNQRSGRKAVDTDDLDAELGKELADVIHYAVAIAAVNNLDLNEIILSKDKKASIKYKRAVNLEEFVTKKRNCE